MIGVLYLMLPYFPTDEAQWQRIIALVIMCVAGALVYGVVLLATGFRPRQLKHG
jgi:putative peptidoglycan lipid II flippase